jgi:uncharacterized membrane protein
MTSTALPLLVGLATLGSALIAGTFFAFSSFIMRALGELPPAAGIAAMQRINVVVLNRSFLGAFVGTAVVSLLVGLIAILGWDEPGAAWFVGGALLYLVGTFAVTAAGNVPLNDRLAEVEAEHPAAVEVWSHYLDRWTWLNTLRTAAAALAVVAFCVGLAL